LYIKFSKKNNIKKYKIYINDNFILSTPQDSLKIKLDAVENLKKKNTLTIKAISVNGKKDEREIEFSIR